MNGQSSNDLLTRRDVLRMTAGGLMAGGLAGCSQRRAGLGASGTSAGSRPNILVIFVDQLRAQACGPFGGRNVPTPNMERMAREGMTFNNAVSACPICTPYRAMLQTGRYPTHSGVVCNRMQINPNQPCMAPSFAEAGYHTGFIGKWHLSCGYFKNAGKHIIGGGEINQQRCQDYEKAHPHYNFIPPGSERLGYQHWQAFDYHTDYNDYYWYEDDPVKVRASGYETDIQADQAIAAMEHDRSRGRPFFLTVAPHPPHPPFNPALTPPGYLDKVPQDLYWPPNVPENTKLPRTTLDARCYYAMIIKVDETLGKLMDYLNASGLSDNTVVVFTSDHGTMLNSRGRQNKMLPWAESVNIPLMMRWPGRIAANMRTDTPHSPIDHLTTLCGLAGVDKPDTADGFDFSNLLLGREKKTDQDAVLLANYVSSCCYFETGTSCGEWRAVKTVRFSYIKWRTGVEELYDNEEDPHQMRNLAEGQKDLPTMQRLRSRLADLMADAHDDFRPGTGYADWYDDDRNLVRNALGPV